MRGWTVFLLIGVLVAGAIAIAYQNTEERAELTLHYISYETLDPTMTQASADVRVAYALFEGLCTYDPYTFTVLPGVAERWEVSEDGMTYTFYLRANAKWSDGTPVTSRDFVETWREGMMPDFAPPYVDFLRFIKGAKAFGDWCTESVKDIKKGETEDERVALARARVEQARAKFDEMVGVRAVDDHTIEVVLAEPCGFFLDLAASWPLFPLPRHVMEEFNSIDATTYMQRRDPQWIKAGNIISNGPYKLKHWRFKRDVLMEANEHYHAADKVKSKSLRMIRFTDEVAAYNGYVSGLIDAQLTAAGLPYMAEILEQGQAGERNDVNSVGSFGTYYFALNNRPKLSDGRDNPFHDVRVRRAFAMTVDKRSLVEDVTRLKQNTYGVFVPPGAIPGYNSPPGQVCLSDAKDDAERQAMIAEARGLLEQAGFPMSEPVEIIYNTGSGHEQVSQALAAMWESYLGVKTSLRGQEWKVFLGERNKGHFTIARSGWFGDYGDPTTFLDLFKEGHGNNDFGTKDPKYEAMLQAAVVERDPAKRMQLLSDAERYIMTEQYAMIPLYQYELVHLYDPDRVTGVTHHPRNLQFYMYIDVLDPSESTEVE